MKDLILKIAGVKDEKSFYKKFPTQEAFMAKHGGAFKKAQNGLNTSDNNGNGIPDYLESTQFPKPPMDYNEPIYNPTVQSGLPTYTPTQLETINHNQQIIGAPPVKPEGEAGTPFDLGKGIPIIGGVLGGIKALGAEKEARRAAKQAMKVSDITLQASASRPETIQRKYVRPEDIPIQPNQLFPTYGVGTNALTAKDGIHIKPENKGKFTAYKERTGKTTEEALHSKDPHVRQMANFAKNAKKWDHGRYGKTVNNGGGEPEQLFDYGYVPLDDSSQVKQYQMGGSMFSSMMGGGDSGSGIGGGVLGGGGFGSNPYGNMVGGMFGGNNGGSQIGGSIGSVFGPVGGAVGSALGGILDDNQTYIDRYNKKTNRNIQTMMLNNSAPAVQAGYASYLEDGGKMQSYGMGGELETHWGGHPETISQNKYLPNTGETVMFKGQSHDESDGKGNSGIGITYGNNPVEVEHGEPAVELPDENGNNLTVFGNLKISKEYAPLLGDSKAVGKKFKNYVADLSKTEAKQNALSEKSINQVNDLSVHTPFDKLKLTTLQANVIGTNMKLKDIAEKKMNAAHLQNAILQEAEERGVKPEAIATARFGKTMKAINGTTSPETTAVPPDSVTASDAMVDYPRNQHPNNKYYGKVTDTDYQQLQQNNPWFDWDGFNPSNKDDVRFFQESFNRLSQRVGSNAKLNVDGQLGEQTATAKVALKTPVTGQASPASDLTPITPAATAAAREHTYGTTPYKRSVIADVANQVLPFIRPTDQEAFDTSQLYGEMYALSNNQVDPVQAQTYQPELGTPYDISLQDNLNANQADYRSVERLLPGNPASLAILNAQKYGANERVLGDQFRANQAMKDKVYSENRNTLNDAKLKNLSIYDQQYVRQSQAVSNTKATAQAAINSITDKYAKNKLENRTLGVYENMYNYRYDPAGRAINLNPLYQPNLPTYYGKQENPDYVPVYDKEGNIKEYRPSMATPGINGNAKNGKSIIRSFK